MTHSIKGTYGCYYTATQVSIETARSIDFNSTDVTISPPNKWAGYSVRANTTDIFQSSYITSYIINSIFQQEDIGGRLQINSMLEQPATIGPLNCLHLNTLGVYTLTQAHYHMVIFQATRFTLSVQVSLKVLIYKSLIRQYSSKLQI